MGQRVRLELAESGLGLRLRVMGVVSRDVGG